MGWLQFERFCRPYYSSGFNAYELVETAMVSKRAETVGEQGRAKQQLQAAAQQAAAHCLGLVDKHLGTVWVHTSQQACPSAYTQTGTT